MSTKYYPKNKNCFSIIDYQIVKNTGTLKNRYDAGKKY